MLPYIKARVLLLNPINPSNLTTNTIISFYEMSPRNPN
jgi:hypothetical protein